MNNQLGTLIEKIKKEGVQAAQHESNELLKSANTQAQTIIGDAHKKAKEIADQAKKDADILIENGKKTLAQASRDVVLLTREKLIELCDKLLTKSVHVALTPDIIASLITRMIAHWDAKKNVSLEVLVSAQDKEAVEKLILAQAKEQVRNNVVIKISPYIEKGFRIGQEGDNVHYDFSDESISQALKELVNPALGALLSTDG